MGDMQVDADFKGPSLNCGILSRPDGSAIYSHGKTTVLAGIYGPVECKTHKILIDKANVEAYFRPKAGLPGIGDRLNETIIRNTCETALLATLFPRSSVLVIIQELENGGQLLSCALNAACLALIDSGIDMKFLFAAVTCCMDDTGALTVDPSEFEQKKAKAVFTFVFDNADGTIVACHTHGCFEVEKYEEAIDVCRRNSVKVFEYYKDIVRRKCDK